MLFRKGAGVYRRIFTYVTLNFDPAEEDPKSHLPTSKSDHDNLSIINFNRKVFENWSVFKWF